MAENFSGKRALVTGAGKGIGRTTAVRLAELGAHVVAISRTQADLDSLKEQVPGIDICLLDIADWEKTRSAVELLLPIDLLVNNAGVSNSTTFLDVTKEELYNVHDINVKAVFNISQVVARDMIARDLGGAIVNISSVRSKRTAPNRALYSTSKAALDMLSTTMAVDLGPHKIRVNSVNPGVVLTRMAKAVLNDPQKIEAYSSKAPLRRTVEEGEIADAIVYLLSDKSAMITGQNINVDGGISV